MAMPSFPLSTQVASLLSMCSLAPAFHLHFVHPCFSWLAGIWLLQWSNLLRRHRCNVSHNPCLLVSIIYGLFVWWIESHAWQKRIYTSYHQQLPIKQTVTFKGQIIGMGIGEGERLYRVQLDAPQLGIIFEELLVWENVTGNLQR
jgi:hypothetical protein